MQYARLKALIHQHADEEGNEVVTVPLNLFRHLLDTALKGRNVFDEKYYLDMNPDVRRAVEKGLIESGAEHYYQTGFFENKLPQKLLVDEPFYISAHPDIAEAVAAGTIKNIQQHFETHGYGEGRLPNPEFTLF